MHALVFRKMRNKRVPKLGQVFPPFYFHSLVAPPSDVNLAAEAIRMTVVPISGVIRTRVVPICGIIGPTVLRIANATGIGYRHDGNIRFSNKLTYALNF